MASILAVQAHDLSPIDLHELFVALGTRAIPLERLA